MKVRKRPVVVEANQWFKLGDVKDVTQFHLQSDPGSYSHDDEKRLCTMCQRTYLLHGLVKTLEGEHIVCPGDWIITGIKSEKYPCKPDIFEQTYEVV